jgi:DNA-3-methyladenine glycosylase
LKLPVSFYSRRDVIKIAFELIGKYLYTNIDGIFTGGIITETEAYNGEIDRASHAYGGRRTARTEIMYNAPGHAYVYLIYGIHSLFNVVTNQAGIPHAVLIRALYPTEGIEQMIIRRKVKTAKPVELCLGPGTVSQALGIHFSMTGTLLTGDRIWIEDKGLKIPKSKIQIGPRIGVDYAGEDASLPYRFRILHTELEKIIG